MKPGNHYIYIIITIVASVFIKPFTLVALAFIIIIIIAFFFILGLYGAAANPTKLEHNKFLILRILVNKTDETLPKTGGV